MIKVLNLTEEGRGGGPLKRISLVGKELQHSEVETLVVFPNKGADEFENSLKSLGVGYKMISLHRLTKEKSHLMAYVVSFISEIWAIKNILKEHKIDIIHLNGAWQFKGLFAAKLSRSTKVVWHLNDSSQPALVRSLFKRISGWADGYIFASQRTKDYYEGVSKRISKLPSKVIQAPVVQQKEKSTKTLNLIKDKSESFNLISVGYLNPNKNFELLIKAAALLKGQTDKQINLYIVGGALASQKVYADQLKSLISELDVSNVHLLGHQKDVHSLLKDCQVYVCTSRFEASPISIWESMINGLYVISTDVGDVKNMFEKYGFGKVLPGFEASQLANAILGVLKDESVLEESALMAKKMAESEFSLKKVARQHESIYKEIVNSKS
ncbi:MAG: glycosyltransferase [Roseivirga sp.]|nr:glycosyltransferase [Roseivirga sp.]